MVELNVTQQMVQGTVKDMDIESSKIRRYKKYLQNLFNYLICPKKQVLIPTQIKLGIPPGYYGRIASKSRLAIQNQVHVGAGIIDPDYTGEIKVLLINNSKHYHQVKEGGAIAQLFLEKACIPILKQVKELPTTERGDRGCGSHSPGDSHIYENV